jgi:hypothetical protein
MEEKGEKDGSGLVQGRIDCYYFSLLSNTNNTAVAIPITS